MADISAINLSKSRDRSESDKIRRMLDVVVAGTALVVFAPVMLLIVMAIWLESGRPLLFRQVRLGQYGRPFGMYKFRKFHRSCGTDGSPLTLEGDARMTRVGNFLRASKFDELPQFWNVLMGDMSIIGPRPETPVFADCFANGFERVLDHKPGILGPSQAIFRNESSLFPADSDPTEFYRAVIFPTKARVDLEYYQRRTIFSDVLWVLRGFLAIIGWVPVNGLGGRSTDSVHERSMQISNGPALAHLTSAALPSRRNET